MNKYSTLWRALIGAGLGIGAILSVQAAPSDKYLEDGKRYQEKGDHRSAIIQFKNALQQEADNGAIRLLLAQSYLKVGEAASAEKELRRAQQLGVPAQQVIPLLGQSYLLQHKFRQLLNDFTSFKASSPKLQATLVGQQGTAHLALGEFGPAEEKFNAALKLDPSAEEAMLGRVRSALLQQRLDDAQAGVTDLVKRLPRVAESWLLKGDYHRARGEAKLAADAYHQALDFEPDNISAHLGRAMMLIAERDYVGADKHITSVFKIAPTSPLGQYLKGLAAFQQGQMAVAKEALQQVQAAAPNYVPNYLLLGAIYYSEGQLETAAELLKRYVSAVPTHLPARKLYAATLLKLKQPEGAIETLDVAVKQLPTDAQLLALLGSAYMQKGDSGKGMDYLEQAATVAPNAAAIRMQLALGYLATGQSGEAVNQLESAVDLGQGMREADILLGLTHLQRREFDKAIQTARTLSTKLPNSPMPANMMGVAYLGKQDGVSARKQFEQALKLDGKFSPARMNLAKIDEAAGNNEAAKKHYNAVLQREDSHVGAMLSLARLAEKEGNSQEALKWLQRATERAPDSLEARLMLVQYFLRRSEPNKALNAARELNDRYREHPAALEALGQAQLASGQASSAVASFRKLTDKHPKLAQPHYLLAVAQAQTGDAKNAGASLKKALELQPDHVPSAVALAGMRAEAGQSKEAIEIARRLQKQYVNSPVGYEVEGNVLLKNGKFDDAAKLYEIAYQKTPSGNLAVNLYQVRRKLGKANSIDPMARWLKSHPQDAEMALRVAMAYQADKRNGEAVPYYERVLQKQPDNAVALNNLAWLYYLSGNNLALDYAEKAYRIKPDDASIADTLGWILVQRGDGSRGIIVLQEAAIRAPHIPEIRYHLAVGLDKTGRQDEARKELSRLLRDNKSFPEAQEAQALLDQLQKK